MKCIYCEREFVGARADAKFCSSTCRLRSHRETDKGGVETDNGLSAGQTVTTLDFAKDLKLDLSKDLGVTSWDANGIFLSPDITIEQVRRIRALVGAKNGWDHKEYRD